MRATCSLLLIVVALESYVDAEKCPPVAVNSSLTQSDLLLLLTDPCRYDVLTKPPQDPLPVSARLYIYNLYKTVSHRLKYRVQFLVQLRWHDPRLSFKEISKFSELLGQQATLKRFWIPHVYYAASEKTAFFDQGIIITPTGDVILSRRYHTVLLCDNERGHFPFDLQMCQLTMDSWFKFVELQWDEPMAVTLHATLSGLTEFDLTGVETATAMTSGFYSGDTEIQRFTAYSDAVKKSLVVSLFLSRKFGFYFWDYYAPSVLLVVTSWGSFWVHPDVVPCRIWLALCTMLGFFGLGVMNDAMPQLSHLKLNDIWFIGCNLFIFLSLAEFAFVNIVHRQETKRFPMKRATGKYILKSSLQSEPTPWKEKPSSSLPSSPEIKRRRRSAILDRRKEEKSVEFALTIEELATSNPMLKRHLTLRRKAFSGTLMTNHQMAEWIDHRSRALFPLAFLTFNLIFWTLMFI